MNLSLAILISFLLLALPITVSGQLYFPSRVFSAHQMIITNTVTPGTDMTNSPGVYPYSLTLGDVYDSVDHHAITYSGHSIPSGASKVRFRIYKVANSSTGYSFNLYVHDNSMIRQLNFALLLIGSQGAGYISADEVFESCNLVPSGSTANSSTKVYMTTLPQPITVIAILNSFTIVGTSQCTVGLSTPIVSGANYNFYYYSWSCSMTSIGYVLLVYSTASTVMTAAINTPLTQTVTYPSAISTIEGNSPTPHLYLQGYDKMCLLTMTTHGFSLSGQFLFDLDYPSPLNHSNIGSYSHEMVLMCCLYKFNCLDIDPNCNTCTTKTVCDSCNTPYVLYTYSNLTSQCVQCSDIFSGCLTCTSTACLTCNPPYVLSGASCSILHCQNWTSTTALITCNVCNSGYFIMNNSCILCSDQIHGCSQCNASAGVVACTACQSQYRLTVDGCECLIGILINDRCVYFSNCVTPYVLGNGSVVCMFCNTTLGFLAMPTNGQCKCRQKYHVTNSSCVEICGDGYSLGQYQCDDGNIVDGDGCSSLCTVQVGYRCQNGSSIAPSACFYVGIPLNMTLTSIRRNAELNQALLYFEVYPPILNLKKMDFLSWIELDCPADYTLTEARYDYTGMLSLTVDYSSDLQDIPCSMTLAFNPSIIQAPNVTVLFDAVSQTLPLLIVQHQEQLATINTIFTALSYISLGVFLISLGHKLIGAELTTSLQMVYLSNALYHRVFFFFNEVRRLQFTTGYWALFYNEIDVSFSPPFSQRVDTTCFFLESNLLVTIFLITATTLLLVLKIVHHKKTANTTQLQEVDTESEQPVELQRLECAMVVLYRMVIFPVAAGFMLVLMISSQIYSFRLDELRQPTFPHIVNVVAMALIYLVLSNVSSAELVNKSKKFTGFRGAKFWYIPLFIFRSLAMVILISLGITHKYDTLAFNILAVQVVYLLFLIFKRPYRRALDNVGVIILQFTTLYALALPVAMRYISVSELDQILLVFILQGLICISMGLSIARTLVYYINATKCCSRCLELQDEAVMIEAEPALAIEYDKKTIEAGGEEEEERRQIQEMNPYSIYNHVGRDGIDRLVARANQTVRRRVRIDQAQLRAVRQEEEEREEDPELAACKARLREDLLKKKEKEKVGRP